MNSKEIKTEFMLIPMGQIELNEGQLDGLPANPRDIIERKFELLKKSILMHPEMMGMRALIVYPVADKRYIIIGGNMRYRGLEDIAKMSSAQINIALGKCSGYAQLSEQERADLRNRWAEWLKTKTIHCIVIPKDTPIERMKAYAILDNNSFGKWQWDMLANEWDAEELTEWGTDLPIMESEIDPSEFFDELENQDEKEKGMKITVSIPKELETSHDEIKSVIEDALSDYSGIKVK